MHSHPIDNPPHQVDIMVVAVAEVDHHHHHIEEAEEYTEEEVEEEEEDHVDIIPTDVMIMEVDDTLVADVIIDMVL